MFSKKNTHMRTLKRGNKVQTYGIRKFSVGVASVAVAAGIFFGAEAVLAAEETAETTASQTEQTSSDASEVAETTDAPEVETDSTDLASNEDLKATTSNEEPALEAVTSTTSIDEKANEEPASKEQPVDEVKAFEGEVRTREASSEAPTLEDPAKKARRDLAELEEHAIYSPGVHGQKQSYAGVATIIRDGNLNTPGLEKVAGTKVFLQWVNKKGFVSPAYYTTTAPDGRFVFDLSKPLYDVMGNKHEFKLAGDPEFAIRTWAHAPEGYKTIKGGDAINGFHKRLERKNETWDFTAGVNRIVGGEVLFQEEVRQNDWLLGSQDTWQRSQRSDGVWVNEGNYGRVAGKVWYEVDEVAGGDGRVYKFDTWDKAAAGTKVVGSYVNDEVTRLFDDWKKAYPKATLQDFRKAQQQIVTDYQEKHGEGSHIAETVVAVVENNGSYYMPFKGLYGVSAYRQNSGLGKQVSDEEFGKLVKDNEVDHGALMKWNGTVEQKHRHINSDYMYIAPLIDNYAIWGKNFQNNMFTKASTGADDVVDSMQLGSYNIYHVDFAAIADTPVHEVTNYDTNMNYAQNGDVAQTQTSGLLPNTVYDIRWFKDGKPYGDVTEVVSDVNGKVSSVPLTVKDIESPTVFTSALFIRGADTNSISNAEAADSFVAVNDLPDRLSLQPEYADEQGQPGETVKVAPPVFKDKEGAQLPKPDDATFSVDNVFEKNEELTDNEKILQNVTIDPQTGEITVPVPQDAQVGDVIEVPVIVTYKDGSKDNVIAKVMVVDQKTTPPVVESIDDTTVVEGQPMKDIPVKVTNATDETTVEVTGLPEGVTYDPETGMISGTPTVSGWDTTINPETGLQEEERPMKVTVKVTTPGQTPVEETFTITVQRDTDGDGTPDVKDADKDGDGIPNEMDERPYDADKLTPTVTEPTPKEENKTITPEKVVESNKPNTTITAPNVNGMTVDAEGNLVGTPTVDDWTDGETERVVDIPVTVTHGDETETVIVKVPVKRAKTQADKFSGDIVTHVIHKDLGTPTTQEDVDKAVELSPNSEYDGKISVTPNSDLPNGQTVGEFDIPVTITFDDGSTVTAIVGVVVTQGSVQVQHVGHIVEVDQDGQVIKELYDILDASEENIYHTLNTHLGHLIEQGYKVFDYERVVDEETGAVKWTYEVVKVATGEVDTPTDEKHETEQTQEVEEITSTSEHHATDEPSKETTVDQAAVLPETGEATNVALFGTAAMSILAGLGLVARRRKED